MQKKQTAKDIRDYLNYLTDLKSKILFPISLDVDGPLYHVQDGSGTRVATFSKKMYDVFQEL